jgi:hypothetical protein
MVCLCLCAVPQLYAIMHAAMYCFCWLPIPFARGFWRDATKLMPFLRRVVPIDTFKAFHKLVGCIMLGLLLAGGAIFVGTIGARCRNQDDAQSCQAFEPVPWGPKFWIHRKIFYGFCDLSVRKKDWRSRARGAKAT